MQTAAVPAIREPGALESLRRHWPEFLMEAFGLGAFMISACAFGILLQHPSSPIPRWIPNGDARRAVMGVAMGLTSIALVKSPWGQRSGAHYNPAFTLSMLAMRKVRLWDALFYVMFQFLGGALGVMLASRIFGPALRHSSVQFVVTTPGSFGTTAAFVAEVLIAFVLMSVVLRASNSKRWHSLTPYIAGSLVAAWILFEAPISGMSMNPARTFASAWPAGVWTGWWIYASAPPLAMLSAALLYRLRRGDRIYCAKLDHRNSQPCIFRCRFQEIESHD